MKETLEGRFWDPKDRPYLYIAADKMPNVSAGDFHVCRLKDMTGRQIIQLLIRSPADAVYTDSTDAYFLISLVEMGLVVYMPDRVPGVKAWPVHKFGRLIYTVGGVPKDAAVETCKRAADIAISLAGLTATAVAAPFIVPKIRKQSQGRAIFSQTRIGFNGRPFKMYKFRSMSATAEKDRKTLEDHNENSDGHMFKISDDPRITEIGKAIRKTSIDELPQFVNVLKGDMSVVGTRPPLPDEVSTYSPVHRSRLNGKPGITGVWQTHGRSDIKDFDTVVQMDKSYINNPSLRHYFDVIVQTLINAVRKGGDGE